MVEEWAVRACFVAVSLAWLLIHPSAAFASRQFKHVIIIFQENRTPDNLFGSNPSFEQGVDLATSGVTSTGQTIPLVPAPLATCYDLTHSHKAFEITLHEGADKVSATGLAGCVVPPDPQYTFADNSTGTVQPYFDIATNYSFANRMFQTNQGPSYPAHQFIFGGTSQPSTESPLFVAENPVYSTLATGCTAPTIQQVRLIDATGNSPSNPLIYPCFEHPTLSDLLDAAGISWHYYAASSTGIWVAPNSIQHVCGPTQVGSALVCEGPDWVNGDVQSHNPAQILTDIQNCDLASVSWVMPTAAESDHPNVNNGTGPQWVASVVNTLGKNGFCPSGENYWRDTAIFVTWDDWGGFYDHVPPFAVNVIPPSPPAWGDGYTYGFRVPLMVVSAYTPAGYVDNVVHDSGSILYFIERTFGLGFIGPGDTIYSNYADYQAAARGDTMAEFFTLPHPRRYAPIATTVPPGYFLTLPPSNVPVDDE